MDYYNALCAICQPIRAADYPHSLESMRALLKALGNPEQAFPAVVVAGSVGKGTLCHQLAGIVANLNRQDKGIEPQRRKGRQGKIKHLNHRGTEGEETRHLNGRDAEDAEIRGRVGSIFRGAENEAGLVPTTSHQKMSVGLYTSPHLHSFRERFVVDGQTISQADFVRGMMAVQEATRQVGDHYSTFELATALALWWFREQTVDIAVLEVGIGGRWDAVNVVPNVLSIITPIEMEHAAMLGGTLHSIAGHKAGIIQPGGYVISAEKASEVTQVLRQEAEQKGATLEFAAYEQLARTATRRLMQQGIISTVSLPDSAPDIHAPGRMEFVTIGDKHIIIDGAHTPLGAARLRQVLEREWGSLSVLLIVGMLRDKAASELLTLLDDERFQIVLTQAPSHRALPAAALHTKAGLTKAQVCVEPDLNRALQFAVASNAQVVAITGSLRIAAAAREYFGLLSESEVLEAGATRAIFEGETYLTRL